MKPDTARLRKLLAKSAGLKMQLGVGKTPPGNIMFPGEDMSAGLQLIQEAVNALPALLSTIDAQAERIAALVADSCRVHVKRDKVRWRARPGNAIERDTMVVGEHFCSEGLEGWNE